MAMDVPSPWTTCTPHMPTTAPDGSCGPKIRHLCPDKKCCGKDGKCGTGKDYCGDGCQLNWGMCWSNSTSCSAPPLSENGDMHPIPIFPIWPDPPPRDDVLPPGFHVDFGHITFPEWKINWPPPDIVGGLVDGEIERGIIACDAITGWFKFTWPKLKECNAITKAFCKLFRLNCCPRKDGGEEGSDGSILPDDDCPYCDPPPDDHGVEVNGGGKLCDEELENCSEIPDEEGCSSSSSKVDKTVYCSLNTATAGAATSVQTCTSTDTDTRSGCDLAPASTTTLTTTACETATATQTTVACNVITSGSSTQTSYYSTRMSTITGCTVTDGLTSTFSTGCATRTAFQVAVSCSVATARSSTKTYCPKTSVTMISGCDVTATTTSIFTTDCFTRTTATDLTKSCFQMAPTTISGSTTLTPSATCTATASSIWSGCEITVSTTSHISTSSISTCNGHPEITFETVAFTFASNLTTTCGPPTSEALGPCTKIMIKVSAVTDVKVTSGTALAKRESSGSGISCYCPSNTANADVWPVTVCGSLIFCLKEATNTQVASGTPAPITLSS